MPDRAEHSPSSARITVGMSILVVGPVVAITGLTLLRWYGLPIGLAAVIAMYLAVRQLDRTGPRPPERGPRRPSRID
jgi:hypothetical protein